MLSYKGSGRYWSRHIKNHGKEHVETIWYCLFYDKEELTKFALMCSEQWNIVKEKDINGKKLWANECNENGLTGAVTGRIVSDETRKRISKAKKGHPGLIGQANGMFGKVAWSKGLTLTDEKYKGGKKIKVGPAKRAPYLVKNFLVDQQERKMVCLVKREKKIQDSEFPEKKFNAHTALNLLLREIILGGMAKNVN